MGSIPLAANNLYLPPPPDPLKEYGKIVQLRALQQQAQTQHQLAPFQVQQAQQGAESGALELQKQKYIQNMLIPNGSEQPAASSAGIPGQPAQPAGASPAPGAAPVQPKKTADDWINELGSNPLTAGAIKPMLEVREQNNKNVQALQTIDATRNENLGTAAYSVLKLAQAGLPPDQAIAAVESHLNGDPWYAQKIQSDMASLQDKSPKGVAGLLQGYIAANPKSQALAQKDEETATAKTRADAAMIQATNPTKARALRDSLSPDPTVSAPAKQYLQAEQQFEANSASAKSQAELNVSTSPQAVQGAARKAGAEAGARVAAENSPAAIQGAVNKAVGIQKGTQSLLEGPAKDMAAENYYQTGQLPAGARSPGMISSIINRAAELHPGGNLAGNKAAYQANASSLKNVTGTLDTLSAFESTGLKNLKNFTDLAQKIPDTGIPWLNTPMRLVNQKMLGSSDQAAALAAGQVALREIARVTNDPKLSGALTDSARNEVSSLIPANATLPQIKRVAEVLQQDMANVHQGLSQQKQDIQNRISGTPTALPNAQGGAATHRYNPLTGKIEAIP